MGRPSNASTVLDKAVEVGDNLAIYKAQRAMITKQLMSSQMDVKEAVALQGMLTKIMSEIVKLEGLKEELDEEQTMALAEDDLLREILSSTPAAMAARYDPDDEEEDEEDGYKVTDQEG